MSTGSTSKDQRTFLAFLSEYKAGISQVGWAGFIAHRQG